MERYCREQKDKEKIREEDRNEKSEM